MKANRPSAVPAPPLPRPWDVNMAAGQGQRALPDTEEEMGNTRSREGTLSASPIQAERRPPGGQKL